MNPPDRVLIVDCRPIYRETLARELREAGREVVVAETGERGFLLLRDRSQQIGWLYTQAALGSLIDGWILADEYHGACPDRLAVLCACKAGLSGQGDIVLEQPGPGAVASVLGRLIRDEAAQRHASTGEFERHAA